MNNRLKLYAWVIAQQDGLHMTVFDTGTTVTNNPNNDIPQVAFYSMLGKVKSGMAPFAKYILRIMDLVVAPPQQDKLLIPGKPLSDLAGIELMPISEGVVDLTEKRIKEMEETLAAIVKDNEEKNETKEEPNAEQTNEGEADETN